MTSQNPNKQQLMQLLKQQEQLYDRAFSLATSVKSSSHHEAANLTKYTQQLNELMTEVAATDQAISQLTAQLESTNQLKSAEIQEQVARQEATLRTLIERIDASFGHVREQHAQLAESLDSGANRTNMQEAYRTSMRTG